MGLLDDRYPGGGARPWGAGSPSPLLTPSAPPSIAMAQGRAPADFAIHGAAPIPPFSLAGPQPPSPPPALHDRSEAPALPDQERLAQLVDVAKSFPGGIARGTANLLGMIGDAQGLAERYDPSGWLGARFDAAFPRLGQFLRDESARTLRAPIASTLAQANGDTMTVPLPGSSQVQHAVESVTGPFYEPKTDPGHWAETTGELSPLILGGGVGEISSALHTPPAAGKALLDLGRNFGLYAALPALGIEGLREALPDTTASRWAQNFYQVARRVAPFGAAAVKSCVAPVTPAAP
jgi:hypothetical protein